MSALFQPVSALSGVGKVRVEQLAQLHIHTLYDLISHFPRGYEDRTKFVEMANMEVGQAVCFQAMVVSQPRNNHIRKGMDILKVAVSDNSARLNLVFFNQPYLVNALVYGQEYAFYGKLEGDDRGYQITNPLFEPVHAMGMVTNRIVPIYGLTAGISNKMMVGLVDQAFGICGLDLPELLPPGVREKFGLPDTASAYGAIHNPASFEELEVAKKRLIFEEFFVFSLGLQMVRGKRQAKSRMPFSPVELSPFYQALGFELTQAQQRTIDEICQDFGRPVAMNRLVQGDVGSGKTAVAAAAAFYAASNGGQVAFMAPTEILAEQHFRSLSGLFAPLGISSTLLTGSLSVKEKASRKAMIASGQVQLVIGTHALLTGDVAFEQLDLVIADEQHRFGVGQRAALAEKGQSPHLLVMSATPIPRTLALILYGDLDVSIIDQLPPGRQVIDTFLVGEEKRLRMQNFMEKQIEAGNQVYVVCPTIEENEENDLMAAQAVFLELSQTVFPGRSVELLHGKLKGKEKDEIIRRFSAGEVDILVSTTVVEVGVDVPNATLMVIENGDRFGLSQLHQLRGRVGRGKDKSYCILVSDTKNPETRGRLKAFCATNNGFEIAQTDLELRGPGDFFGSRQHGLPMFKVANLALDLDVLKAAQEAALEYGQEIGDLSGNRPLMERISALFQDNLILN